MLKDTLKRFRVISYIEGLSYLILVFIAMPIKYLAENPYPVKIIGMAHGVLFILFVLFLYETMRKYAWQTSFSSKLFVYSLIPFGSFIIEKKMKTI
jgi:integral membrane protein